MGSHQDAISAEAYLFIEVRNRVYRYRIRNTVTAIGSDEDNAVRIREPSVTAHHLMLSYVDGRFHLRRLGDSPARLNDERIEAYTEELRYGDEIGIGDVILRLVEGGRVSDVAIAVSVWPRVGTRGGGGGSPSDVSERPWHLFLTRQTEFRVGDPPADLALPGAGTVAVENFGPRAQYLVPPEGGTVRVNDDPVTRRVRLRDKDTVGLSGYVLRLRMLRGEVMEDPEGILWPEAMRRFAVEGGPRGGR